MKPSKPFLLIVAILLPLAFALPTRADDSPSPSPDKSAFNLFNPTPRPLLRDLDTDRPDKTNTPHTVDAGHIQLELGLADLTHTHDRAPSVDARSDNWTLGEFNLRIGVLNNLELNIGVSAYQFLRTSDTLANTTTRKSGAGDTLVGAKLNLWGNDGADDPWTTALGIQPQVNIPTAPSGLGNGHVEFSVGVPLLVNLPGDFHLSLQTTPGMERTSDNTAYCLGWQNAASLDHTLLPNLDAYVELWNHLTAEHRQKAQAAFDVGIVYQLTSDIALDTGINVGLNSASPAVEWVLGVTLRF